MDKKKSVEAFYINYAKTSRTGQRISRESFENEMIDHAMLRADRFWRWQCVGQMAREYRDENEWLRANAILAQANGNQPGAIMMPGGTIFNLPGPSSSNQSQSTTSEASTMTSISVPADPRVKIEPREPVSMYSIGMQTPHWPSFAVGVQTDATQPTTTKTTTSTAGVQTEVATTDNTRQPAEILELIEEDPTDSAEILEVVNLVLTAIVEAVSNVYPFGAMMMAAPATVSNANSPDDVLKVVQEVVAASTLTVALATDQTVPVSAGSVTSTEIVGNVQQVLNTVTDVVGASVERSETSATDSNVLITQPKTSDTQESDDGKQSTDAADVVAASVERSEASATDSNVLTTQPKTSDTQESDDGKQSTNVRVKEVVVENLTSESIIKPAETVPAVVHSAVIDETDDRCVQQIVGEMLTEICRQSESTSPPSPSSVFNRSVGSPNSVFNRSAGSPNSIFNRSGSVFDDDENEGIRSFKRNFSRLSAKGPEGLPPSLWLQVYRMRCNIEAVEYLADIEAKRRRLFKKDDE